MISGTLALLIPHGVLLGVGVRQNQVANAFEADVASEIVKVVSPPAAIC